jgi:hypothetical protein
MGKARYRRKMESLEARIREHLEKINQEKQKATPDEGLIRHWEREIKAFQKGIRRAQKRLGKWR